MNKVENHIYELTRCGTTVVNEESLDLWIEFAINGENKVVSVDSPLTLMFKNVNAFERFLKSILEA